MSLLNSDDHRNGPALIITSYSSPTFLPTNPPASLTASNTLNTTWNSLPIELISLIFRYASSNEPSRNVNLVLSHTCKRWRAIALNIPFLWQDVRFTTCLDPEYRWAEACLQRSSKCLVDVTVTREAVQFPQPQQPGPSVKAREGSGDDQESATISLGVNRIVNLLLPESYRWRKVDIDLPNPYLYNLIHGYFTRVSQPLSPPGPPPSSSSSLPTTNETTTTATLATSKLTSLSITCDRSNQLTVPRLQIPNLNSTPSLTRLTLNTINVEWKSWDFPHLTHLELARHERESVRPRLNELFHILSNSTLLEELHFNGSGPCVPDSHDIPPPPSPNSDTPTTNANSNQVPIVTLPNLHTLSISRQTSSSDVVSLIHLLRAPVLQSLTLSEWRDDAYDPAISLLGRSPYTGFPSITYLHIRGIEVSDTTYGMDAFGEFLRSATNVTHLFAEMHGMNPLAFLPLTDPAPNLPLPVPKLSCFQVTGPHRACIGRMVESRMSIGSPVKRLILGRLDTTVTKEFNERLEKMVEEVSYVEPADDDDEACEGSEYGEEEEEGSDAEV